MRKRLIPLAEAAVRANAARQAIGYVASDVNDVFTIPCSELIALLLNYDDLPYSVTFVTALAQIVSRSGDVAADAYICYRSVTISY